MTTRRKKHLRARRRRVRDFERMAEVSLDVDPFYRERGLDPVHPLADEEELLERLNMDPSRCQFFDAYWHTADDVVWVQLTNEVEDDQPEESGLYARVAPDDGAVTLLGLREDEEPLTRERVSRVLEAFVALVPGGVFRALPVSRSYRRLGDWPR